MFRACRRLIKDCLTENNGRSYCPVRVGIAALSVGGIPTFVGCTVWSVIHDGHWDPVQFGAAFCAIASGLAAAGGGIAMKAKTDT